MAWRIFRKKKNLSDIGLWMSGMTQSHGHTMKWKKDFFHCHPAPASLWRTVPWSWRWCRDSGQEAALDYPNPSSSSEIEKVILCGCLHRQRAWNSPTAPKKCPNSALLKKKHLHGIGDAFLMHCDDKKTIRHFSGLFFSFITEPSSLTQNPLCYWIKKMQIVPSQEIPTRNSRGFYIWQPCWLPQPGGRTEPAWRFTAPELPRERLTTGGARCCVREI